MINYVTVIFGNYDLLDLQVQNFKKRFPKKDYRLIVIDNTINEHKKTIIPDSIIDEFILLDSRPTHDGISHGLAIDEGLKHCTSEIVCVMDSDLFILNENMHEYIYQKFNEGYKAVGCEFNDGADTFFWTSRFPDIWNNIPISYCGYYDINVAKADSWVETPEDLAVHRSTGEINTGWRISKHIRDNKIKSMTWLTDAKEYGNCFFRDQNTMMLIHYQAGSHRRWKDTTTQEIQNIISLDYSNFKKLDKCLCCSGIKLEPILDLNTQPLANSYLSSPEEEEPTYPLGINYCMDCTHTQLTHVVNPDKLFKHYIYVSGTTKTLKDYFNWFVDFTAKYTTGKTVLDIACNDGSQLDSFKERGYNTYGIDPAKNLHELSSKNHSVVCDYFTDANQFNTKFDIIIAQNVFAHNAYPKEFLEACKAALSETGVIFIQTSQADMIQHNQFDTIYHEHISFFNTKSFCTLAKRAGLNVIDIVRTDVHGSSSVFILSKSQPDKSEILIEESSPISYRNMLKYASNCNNITSECKKLIEQLQFQGKKVIGYGAAAKGNTFINFAKLKLDYIIDDNPLKQNLYSPGSKIPILSPDVLLNELDDLVVVPLAWNFFDEIKERVLKKKTNNIQFLKYFPEVTLHNA